MNAQIMEIDDPRLVKALAHPIRMRIMGILDERTATPKQLAELLGLPLENVSYHVRTLKDYGFIKLEKTRQVRGAVEHHYKLAARPAIGDDLWEQLPRVMKEAITGSHLSQVAESVNQAALQGGFDRRESHIALMSLILDDQGWKECAAILLDAVQQLERVSRESQDRAGDSVGRVHAVTMLYDAPAALAPEEATKRRDARSRQRAKA
ncbi:MAG TPA: helix-turn-helix domain-containing protein [Solirubrobacteraceae bacterium]|nr:helix-turn-helix domain-containing protein [Solirubrobacteraceae bacterium]